MLLEILQHPDPRLRLKAEPVEGVHAIQSLIDDMVETMYAAIGCGLAAPQVGSGLRVFIVDCPVSEEDDDSELRVFVNPQIVWRSKRSASLKEGCLSVPGLRVVRPRAAKIAVVALDRHGVEFKLHAEGLLAVAIQHENDHLDGVLIVD